LELEAVTDRQADRDKLSEEGTDGWTYTKERESKRIAHKCCKFQTTLVKKPSYVYATG